MSRFAVTIVIPVRNAWSTTRACLTGLRPTLSADDQVVVVDNGSTDATPARLREMSWLEVVGNPDNLGYATACNQGAAMARNPIIVFLQNDTQLSPQWLDGLVAPLSDPTVVATGPRTNSAPGRQLIDGPYEVDDRAGIDDFAWLWRLSHAGARTDTRRLDGFCLAVHAGAFRAVGGFDEGFEIGGCEDDDLSLRLAARGGRLLIVDDVFVHHEGHVTFDAEGIDRFEQWGHNGRRLHSRHAGPPALPWPPPLGEREPSASGPLVTVLVHMESFDEGFDADRAPELLRRALTSVADSTLEPVDVVLALPGPRLPEALAAVVAEAAARLPIQVVPGPGLRNEAVLVARGEFLAFLDFRCAFVPGHLETAVQALRRSGRSAAAHGYVVEVTEDDEGKATSRAVAGDHRCSPELLRVVDLLEGSAPVVPADDVRAVGGVDERLDRMRTWELWLRLQDRVEWLFVPQPGTHWFRPAAALTRTTEDWFSLRQALYAVYEQHPVVPNTPAAAQRDFRRTRPAAFAAPETTFDTVVRRSRASDETSFDVSVVVACTGDQLGLVRTLESVATTLSAGRWELLLCLPEPREYRHLLDRIDGDLAVYRVGAAGPDEIWTFATEAATGRSVLLVREGEVLDSLLVLAALRGPAGTASQVGVRTSEEIPLPRLAGAR